MTKIKLAKYKPTRERDTDQHQAQQGRDRRVDRDADLRVHRLLALRIHERGCVPSHEPDDQRSDDVRKREDVPGKSAQMNHHRPGPVFRLQDAAGQRDQ